MFEFGEVWVAVLAELPAGFYLLFSVADFHGILSVFSWMRMFIIGVVRKWKFSKLPVRLLQFRVERVIWAIFTVVSVVVSLIGFVLVFSCSKFKMSILNHKQKQEKLLLYSSTSLSLSTLLLDPFFS